MIVKDDVLTETEIDYFIKNKNKMYEISKFQYPKVHYWDKKKKKNFFNEFLDLLFEKKLIKDTWSTYEYWMNPTTNGKLPWHKDKDEYYYKFFNKVINPSMSCVFYFDVNCVGGELIIKMPDEDLTVKPEKNRLVMFDCSYTHKVNPFTGDRIALSINLWSKKPPSLSLNL
tara:strand:+ start:1090 stop:1602 length:513 start_codon:yes stop_codon:yes gene_type:complete